ncbi:MAG: RHS repeat-associated core domain-containing protein [Zavarzinella sp.]
MLNRTCYGIVNEDRCSSITTRVDYKIDVFGNLVQQDTDTGLVVTERFAFEIVDTSPGITHSVHRRWTDLDGSNAIVTRYLDSLARSDGTDLEWLLTDRLGSITEMLDDTGAIVKELKWDAFGNIVNQSGSTSLGNIGFTGMFFDVATGLGFTKYRPYNFGLGQFIGEDPIGFDAGDANLRRYVRNNGLNGTDLSGLEFDIVELQKELSVLIGNLIEEPNIVNRVYYRMRIKIVFTQIATEWDRILSRPYQGNNIPVSTILTKPDRNKKPNINWYLNNFSLAGPLTINPEDEAFYKKIDNVIESIHAEFKRLGDPAFLEREAASENLNDLLYSIYKSAPAWFDELINKYLQHDDPEVGTRTAALRDNVLNTFIRVHGIKFKENNWDIYSISLSVQAWGDSEMVRRYTNLLVRTVKDRRVAFQDKRAAIDALRRYDYSIIALREYYYQHVH